MLLNSLVISSIVIVNMLPFTVSLTIFSNSEMNSRKILNDLLFFLYLFIIRGFYTSNDLSCVKENERKEPGKVCKELETINVGLCTELYK